jgi:hypothetical protein
MKNKYFKYLTKLLLSLIVMSSSNLMAQDESKLAERNAVFFIKPFHYQLIRDAIDPDKVGTSCASIKVHKALRPLEKNKESNCKAKIDLLKELKEHAEAGVLLNQAFPSITPFKLTVLKAENGLGTILRLQNSLWRQDYFRNQSECENALQEYYRQLNLPQCKFEPKALDDVPND